MNGRVVVVVMVVVGGVVVVVSVVVAVTGPARLWSSPEFERVEKQKQNDDKNQQIISDSNNVNIQNTARVPDCTI